MSVPYTPALITRLVRDMSDEKLATLHPHDFHRSPVAKVIVPSAVIREIIQAESSRRLPVHQQPTTRSTSGKNKSCSPEQSALV